MLDRKIMELSEDLSGFEHDAFGILLFSSYTKGSEAHESDIDVCIIKPVDEVLAGKSNQNLNNSEKSLGRNTEEPLSIISLFFDQIHLKSSFKKIISKTPIKVTDQFIDAFILMSFLAYVFYKSDVLRFELSYSTWPLIIIGAFACIEFIAINTTLFKKFLVEDVKTKAFIDKIPYMDIREVEDENKFRNFSPRCMDYFLRLIEKDGNKFPPYFIDLVFETQQLRPKNLDLLFGTNIILNIRPDLAIKILNDYQDYLSKDTILNLYDIYKNNDDVIKVLFATQKDSYYLVQNLPENSEVKFKLDGYYKKYQLDNQHIDWSLKTIRILFKAINNLLLRLLVYSVALGYIIGGYQLRDTELNILIVVLVFIMFQFDRFIIKPILRWMDNFSYKRYINNITKCDAGDISNLTNLK